jgi:ornithine cyclodeaminase
VLSSALITATSATRSALASSGADADIAVGAVLRDGLRDHHGRSIAELTGIGAADAAVASAVVQAFG